MPHEAFEALPVLRNAEAIQRKTILPFCQWVTRRAWMHAPVYSPLIMLVAVLRRRGGFHNCPCEFYRALPQNLWVKRAESGPWNSIRQGKAAQFAKVIACLSGAMRDERAVIGGSEFEQSGLKRKVFCEARVVGVSRLDCFRYRSRRRERQGATPATRLVPVELVGAVSSGGGLRVELATDGVSWSRQALTPRICSGWSRLWRAEAVFALARRRGYIWPPEPWTCGWGLMVCGAGFGMCRSAIRPAGTFFSSAMRVGTVLDHFP